MKMASNLAILAAVAALAVTNARAQVNAAREPEATLPFVMKKLESFNRPWRIAFLPDGRMLITERVGPVWLVTQEGHKTQVANVPAVVAQGQGGMLGVFLSPHYASDQQVYLTYSAPAEGGGSGLALARARLTLGQGTAGLEGLKVLWRDAGGGNGGHPGAAVAFSPDGKFLFLTTGDRQRFWPVQDPSSPLGKVLRLTLDGEPAPGNPWAGKTGAPTLPIIDPPLDTEVGKTAPVLRTFAFPGPNLTPSETWTLGHRNPTGLFFAPDGRLWEIEHGPRGGDELNLIEPGKNYGWPLVSFGANNNGVPIPNPDTRPDLEKPALYWVPDVAPGNMVLYKGAMFPQWNGNGSVLIASLARQSLVRIVITGATAMPAERWDVGWRVRDVAVAPDGAVWMLQDANPGGVFRVTPK
jgi:aldose sugar dehydrogenase